MNKSHDYLKGMQRKVGIFLLFGLGFLLLVVMLSAIRSNFFAKKFYVHIQPPTATAFYEGQPVRFQGFGIGYVYMIELMEHGKVQISMQLLDKYRPMLHEGAVVQLAKEGMIGEQFVRISAGVTDAPMLQDQMILDYESEASIEQIIEDLKPTIARADRLLGELGDLVAWVNDPEGDIRLTIANVREISGGLSSQDIQEIHGEIKSVSGEMKSLMRHVGQVVVEVKQEGVVGNLSHALEATAGTLDEMKPMMHEVSKSSGESLQQMNIVLVRMQGLIKSLNVVSSDMGELTPELPGLARELRDSVGESRLLMRSIRHSWLLGDGRGGSDIEEDRAMKSLPAVNLRP